MPVLQDAHIHLHDGAREGKKILACAGEHGVGRFFCNSAAPADWPAVKRLSEASDRVVPFFGVHPWEADKVSDGWDSVLKDYLAYPEGCIGEIGLDATKKNVDIGVQLKIFSRQLDMAVELDKPFAVHCVQAWDILLEELGRRGGAGLKFMVHWFSGSPEVASELIKLGGYISFSPRLLYERAKKHRASFEACPSDRILLETDYPYMPDTFGGAAPEAAKYFEWLSSLYAFAAKLKNTAEADLAGKVWENGTVFLHRAAHRQR